MTNLIKFPNKRGNQQDLKTYLLFNEDRFGYEVQGKECLWYDLNHLPEKNNCEYQLKVEMTLIYSEIDSLCIKLSRKIQIMPVFMASHNRTCISFNSCNFSGHNLKKE